jgi:hypothetical protein
MRWSEGHAFKFARAHASMNVSRVVSKSGYQAAPVSQHWRLNAVRGQLKSAKQVFAHFRALLARWEDFFATPPGNYCYSDSCACNLRNLDIYFAAISAGINSFGRMKVRPDLSEFWIERACGKTFGYGSIPEAHVLCNNSKEPYNSNSRAKRRR